MSRSGANILDLMFSEEEIAFREEVREFMAVALPDAIRAKMMDRRELAKEDIVGWQRILNARGWATPSWPKEYGGPGWSPVQRYIFLDELYRAPAPEPLTFNVNMIGPLLMAFGSGEQKRRLLPRIANLDDWWCQGFSEPGSGSDLASLTTSARRDGDCYIVRGQKIWTTFAHFADWMFCLLRTTKEQRKQQGISILIIDMKSPGITVRPIVYIDGRHECNEVFFDDVRVPVENRIGEDGHGWEYAKYLLSHERIGIARIGTSRQRIARARQLAASVLVDGVPLDQDEGFRRRVEELEVDLLALEMTQLRILSAQQNRTADTSMAPSSVLKIKGSELQQRTAELLLDVAGANALSFSTSMDDATSPLAPTWAAPATANYFFARAFSIYGGSNEIQKNIISRTLGL